MKLGEFIKNFSHNNVIRLLYKDKGGHRLVLDNWNDISMDWAVNKQQGKFRHYVNNEVIGLAEITFIIEQKVHHPEAINIVIEELENQPFLEETSENKLSCSEAEVKLIYIDKKLYGIKEQFITGLQLKEMAQVPNNYGAWLQRYGLDLDDEIADTEQVDLNQPYTEIFYTGVKTYPIKEDIQKESKIGYNDPNPDPNCGATTAELMMILGKSIDEALDIHNNINKIINENLSDEHGIDLPPSQKE